MAEADVAARGAQGFKGQPWILYDTVAARSFLAGDDGDDGRAIGSRVPAVSAKGELSFFQERTRKQVSEVYTNLDVAGQLSYGMEVWGVYVQTMLPIAVFAEDGDASGLQMAKLAEVLLHGSAILVDLGQEEQSAFHTLRFGAGGGMTMDGVGGPGAGVIHTNNGIAYRRHMMVYPEPIEMPRTQNFGVSMELSPEALDLIGTVAAPGVGVALAGFEITVTPFGEVSPIVIDKRQLPYMVQVGFVGRRVKKTQYGQLSKPRSKQRPAAR
jgi:hypothetical protein